MKSTPEIGYVNLIISKQNMHEAMRRNTIVYFKLDNPMTNFSLQSTKRTIERHIRNEIGYIRIRGLSFDYLEDLIYIDLKVIKEDFETDFLKHLCETISHETIHIVLRKLDGLKACREYDNIYNNLRIRGYSGC